MSFFKKILNSMNSVEQYQKEYVEKRVHQRFAYSEKVYPELKCSIEGKPFSLFDVSHGGLGGFFEDELPVKASQPVTVDMSIEKGSCSFLAIVKWTDKKSSKFGVQIIFKTIDEVHFFYQLLYPFLIGVTLKKMDPEKVRQDSTQDQMFKEVYLGSDQAILTVWRERSEEERILSVELKTLEFAVRKEVQSRDFVFYEYDEEEIKTGIHATPELTPISQEEKVLEFTKLVQSVAATMGTNVAPDVRELFHSIN